MVLATLVGAGSGQGEQLSEETRAGQDLFLEVLDPNPNPNPKLF